MARTTMVRSQIRDGRIFIGEEIVEFPGFKPICQIGKGSNAEIYLAEDTFLQRKVAIKIWNDKGKGRAQFETAKIAQYQHSLFVSTYQFGSIDEHLFAVMEYVDGINGKQWLDSGPDVGQRIRFWSAYSRALSIIYSDNQLHGDPHLGNVLLPRGKNELSLKLADIGTSVFWKNRGEFIKREENILTEVAGKLFNTAGIFETISIPEFASHGQILFLVDSFVNFLWRSHFCADWDVRTINADMIANIICNAPVFNIEMVFKTIRETRVTDQRRLSRRLSAYLRGADYHDYENFERAANLPYKYLYEEKKKAFHDQLRSVMVEDHMTKLDFNYRQNLGTL